MAAGAAGAAGANGQDGAAGATGPAGAQGPAGPQGVKGDTGNTGATGAQGAQGPRGFTGAAGASGHSAWEEIPSGTTITGSLTWSQIVPASSAATITVPVNLPGVAPTALSASAVNVLSSGSVLTDGDPAVCTGSAASPTATPGAVCVYIDQPTGDVTSVTGAAVTFNRTRGFAVRMAIGNTGGLTELRGSWAYRTP